MFQRFINTSDDDKTTWQPLGTGVEEVKIELDDNKEYVTPIQSSFNGIISDEIKELLLQDKKNSESYFIAKVGNEEYKFKGIPKVFCRCKFKKKGKRWIKRVKDYCSTIEVIGEISND